MGLRLCYFLGIGDVYGLDGWFGTAFDKAILGEVHLYYGEGVAFDPRRSHLFSRYPAEAWAVVSSRGSFLQKTTFYLRSQFIST